jgi:hypothetical protein
MKVFHIFKVFLDPLKLRYAVNILIFDSSKVISICDFFMFILRLFMLGLICFVHLLWILNFRIYFLIVNRRYWRHWWYWLSGWSFYLFIQVIVVLIVISLLQFSKKFSWGYFIQYFCLLIILLFCYKLIFFNLMTVTFLSFFSIIIIVTHF